MTLAVTDAYVALATQIIERTAREYSTTPAEIIGPDRTRAITRARAAAAYRMWSESDLSLVRIGQILGGRDHSTIHYLIGRHTVSDAGRAEQERITRQREHGRLYAGLETAAQLAELAGHHALAADLRAKRRVIAGEIDADRCEP